MMAMYRAGTSKMGAYYASAQKMNNTIVEYINGMEVVKVFNRDGESYQRFEQDVRGYRDFTLAWYKVCWPWMALYNSILPCVALFTLPIGAYLVLRGYSTPAGFRPGAVHVLRRGCAPAAGAGVYVHPAPDQLQDHRAGAADGRAGSGADRGRLLR